MNGNRELIPCVNCKTLSAVCLARYQLGQGKCCGKCKHPARND